MMSEQDMDAINYGDVSDHDLISTEMLEDIRDGSQTHLNVNRRKARYKIRDRIRKRQYEWKGALKSTQNTGKGLHKVSKIVVKDISQYLPSLGESDSEVSHFIPELGKFSEVKKLLDDIKKPWLKSTLKEIKNLMNNQTFIVNDSVKDEPVTPCIDVKKDKIQSDGSLDKLNMRIVVRKYLQNKELVVDTWSPTASMRTLKYFLAYSTKQKAGVNKLDFIGSFLQAKFRNRVFVKLDSRYADYFTEY